MLFKLMMNKIKIQIPSINAVLTYIYFIKSMNRQTDNPHKLIFSFYTGYRCLPLSPDLYYKKATPGFEPGIKALQASALPLGHVAVQIIIE